MFHLLISEFRYNKVMVIIAYLTNVSIFLTFSIFNQRDNADLFFNPGYWNFSTADVIMFNPIFAITLTLLIIIPLRFLAQIPVKKTDRLYSLLPLSQIIISISRFIFPILFWLTLVFLLLLLQMILYPIFTLTDTINILLSLTGIFFILCAFFLIVRDAAFCFTRKTQICGIPNNVFPSIFLVIIYSGIILLPFLTDTIFGIEHFTQKRSDILIIFFSLKGAILLNIFGLGMFAANNFIFIRRLSYLE